MTLTSRGFLVTLPPCQCLMGLDGCWGWHYWIWTYERMKKSPWLMSPIDAWSWLKKSLEVRTETSSQNKSIAIIVFDSLTWPLPLQATMLRPGFLRAIQLVMRLEEGSVISAGPPCGSWVFINAATHGRTRSRPMGNANTRDYVRNANRILVNQLGF